jgi:lysophospholipase L1-like esterase
VTVYKNSLVCLPALAVAVAVAGCTSPAPPPAPPPPPARTPPTGAQAPLLPFFLALDSLAVPGAAPITVLQIGDSHTANDSFSSRMRDQLQARFGNAGRGPLPPGEPFRWYRPEAVSVTQAGFTAISAFSLTTSGPFGIADVRQHAAGPADATLSATDGAVIGVAEVELMAQPGGGTVQVSAPPAPGRTISTNGAPGPLWVGVPVQGGAGAVSVHAMGDGPVDWLGWSVARGSSGIFYADLGYPGATIDILDRWDPALVGAELAHLHPALILLAFGTNEGFKDRLDPAAYAQTYSAQLTMLHQAAPGASIIAVAPPDGQRPRGRGRPEAQACDAHWAIPPNLAEIRDIQRSAAAANNAFYWDWSAAMGGPCTMARWVQAVPQLGAPDHVHMRTPGYAITADVLFGTLMQAYDRYRGSPGGS